MVPSLEQLVLQKNARDALGGSCVNQVTQVVSIRRAEISNLINHPWVRLWTPFRVSKLHILELRLGGDLGNDAPSDPIIADGVKSPLINSTSTTV